jgi:hypothetical protein
MATIAVAVGHANLDLAWNATTHLQADLRARQSPRQAPEARLSDLCRRDRGRPDAAGRVL